MDAQVSHQRRIVFVVADQPRAQLVQACSRDYGFDFDVEEIGREMLAPLPAGLSTYEIPQDGSYEYECVQLEFLA